STPVLRSGRRALWLILAKHRPPAFRRTVPNAVGRQFAGAALPVRFADPRGPQKQDARLLRISTHTGLTRLRHSQYRTLCGALQFQHPAAIVAIDGADPCL